MIVRRLAAAGLFLIYAIAAGAQSGVTMYWVNEPGEFTDSYWRSAPHAARFGNRYLIAFEGQRADGVGGIFAALSTTDGTATDRIIRITGEGRLLAAGTTDSGFVIASSEQAYTRLTLLNAAGDVLNTALVPTSGPSVALICAEPGCIEIYREATEPWPAVSGTTVSARLFSLNGTVTAERFELAQGGLLGCPSVALDGDAFVVIWQDVRDAGRYDAGAGDWYGARITPAPAISVLGPVFVAKDASVYWGSWGSRGSAPTLACGGGSCMLGRAVNYYDVSFLRFNADLSPSSDSEVKLGMNEAFDPIVIYDGLGFSWAVPEYTGGWGYWIRGGRLAQDGVVSERYAVPTSADGNDESPGAFAYPSHGIVGDGSGGSLMAYFKGFGLAFDNVQDYFPLRGVRARALVSVIAPESVSAVATSILGTEVTFEATGASALGGSFPVVCHLPSGSLFPLGISEVVCTANDGAGNEGSARFPVSVTFAWSGVLQPLNADGSSVFRRGSTIPFKFRLTDASAQIEDLAAVLRVSQVSSSVLGSTLESSAIAAADEGSVFRFDPVQRQYMFNWRTTGLAPGTYNASIEMSDGVERSVLFSLR